MALAALLCAGCAGIETGSRCLPRSGAAPLAADAVLPAELAAEGAPSLGPADAPVTLVAFEDFQCPVCAASAAVLEQVAALYPAQLRVVFRHNPLAMHVRAMSAAVAAECAHAQKKFWPMRAQLLSSSPSLETADLRAAAERAGLDLHRYDACYFAKDQARIRSDMGLAERSGAVGAPNYFVNGRPLFGARTAEGLRFAIEQALHRGPTP
jgi:protein-disulfide isomerase